MSFQKLSYQEVTEELKVSLPYSKSIANRLLVANALSDEQKQLENLSEAMDTIVMQAALNSNEAEIDVGMAGTAYRFMTAYLATQKDRVTVLKGAKRMHQRPIGVLVDALRELGATIDYLDKEGFPPLQIQGKQLEGGELNINAGVSSQFISAILLVAPTFAKGLRLNLNGRPTSKPYIDMTMSLMQQLGIEISWQGKSIEVKNGSYFFKETIVPEVDWSSAAFFYQLFAIAGLPSLQFNYLSLNSIQGDRIVADIFENFGVKSETFEDGVILIRTGQVQKNFQVDLRNYPDLVPAVAVTAAILSEELTIKGVESLRIKESDRVKALKVELSKINSEVIEIGEDTILIKGVTKLPGEAKFNSYYDHRMAMSMAPLALLIGKVELENPFVVEKSFPGFWEELAKCGIRLN